MLQKPVEFESRYLDPYIAESFSTARYGDCSNRFNSFLSNTPTRCRAR